MIRGEWPKTIFKIVGVLLIFVVIGMTNTKTRNATITEVVFNKIIEAPQRIYRYVREYVSGNDNFFAQVDELKEKNENLQSRVKELEEKTILYEQIYAENQVLKSHLILSEKYPEYKAIVADVISDSTTNWEATYIVNCGSKQGVKAGMVVVAEDGLVGYVETVSDSTSKIVSILDAGNSLSARVTRTRDEIVCKGMMSLAEEQELKILNIPLDTILTEGDRIETSGVGGIYPKGIAIGKISEITYKNNPVENEAKVKTFVNFNKLESVAIIVSED